jgi:hypothetical protein
VADFKFAIQQAEMGRSLVTDSEMRALKAELKTAEAELNLMRRKAELKQAEAQVNLTEAEAELKKIWEEVNTGQFGSGGVGDGSDAFGAGFFGSGSGGQQQEHQLHDIFGNVPRKKFLPKLTDQERGLLNRYKGCFKCRRFNVTHKAASCPSDFPSAESYQSLTEADALKAMSNAAS